MLQSTEQRSSGDDQTPEAFRFLIEFTRALIKNNPSQDSLMLAMYAASAQCNISREQAHKFMLWVMEAQDDSPWPKGFF